jgi:hypothetical protein
VHAGGLKVYGVDTVKRFEICAERVARLQRPRVGDAAIEQPSLTFSINFKSARAWLNHAADVDNPR